MEQFQELKDGKILCSINQVENLISKKTRRLRKSIYLNREQSSHRLNEQVPELLNKF